MIQNILTGKWHRQTNTQTHTQTDTHIHTDTKQAEIGKTGKSRQAKRAKQEKADRQRRQSKQVKTGKSREKAGRKSGQNRESRQAKQGKQTKQTGKAGKSRTKQTSKENKSRTKQKPQRLTLQPPHRQQKLPAQQQIAQRRLHPVLRAPRIAPCQLQVERRHAAMRTRKPWNGCSRSQCPSKKTDLNDFKRRASRGVFFGRHFNLPAAPAKRGHRPPERTPTCLPSPAYRWQHRSTTRQSSSPCVQPAHVSPR